MVVTTRALAQKVEYIWVDNTKTFKFNSLRSRTRVLQDPVRISGGSFPEWSFDGTSTGQVQSGNSDLVLRPVFSCFDPIRGENNALVLCEVLNADRTPSEGNTRSQLAAVLTKEVVQEAPLFGFKQTYTMLGKSRQVYGWPMGGFPSPQASYYCGVGTESAYGRPLAEAHLDACVRAGLAISGISAGSVPGQWTFQLGPAGPLELGDMAAVTWGLLHRIGEDFGVSVSVDPAVPSSAGQDLVSRGAPRSSFTFSTGAMRKAGGIAAVNAAVEKLSSRHAEVIAQYSEGAAAAAAMFTSGVGERESSVRVPQAVATKGMGHLEDRRTGPSADPYIVARVMIEATLVAGGSEAVKSK